MSSLNIRQDNCKLDFLSLGSLIHRLDPGVIPFRKARNVDIHVSGGEYNVAAGLSDCFGLNTGIASAMVDYGIGELVETRVREMGVKPYFKRFEHKAPSRPQHQPYPHTPPNYGAKKQYAKEADKSPLLDKHGKKFIMQVNQHQLNHYYKDG